MALIVNASVDDNRGWPPLKSPCLIWAQTLVELSSLQLKEVKEGLQNILKHLFGIIVDKTFYRGGEIKHVKNFRANRMKEFVGLEIAGMQIDEGMV